MTDHLKKIIIVLLIFLPVRGRTDAMSWQELSISPFNPRRDPASASIYRNHIKQLKSQNKTTEQVIFEDIFKIHDGQSPATNIKPDYRLVINSFPYWLEENIVHLLVFSNTSNWNKDELNQASIDTLARQLPDLFNKYCFDYVIQINVPENRTVKGLAHTHIFIRTRDQSQKVFNLIKDIPFSRPGVIPRYWPKDQNHQQPHP